MTTDERLVAHPERLVAPLERTVAAEKQALAAQHQAAPPEPCATTSQPGGAGCWLWTHGRPPRDSSLTRPYGKMRGGSKRNTLEAH
jgi:hypothetical protein